MSQTAPTTRHPNMVDQVADSASNAIHATQRAADGGLGRLDSRVQDLRNQAAPALDRAARRAEELAGRGSQALRDTSRRIRDSAAYASDSTVQYVRDQPVKSVLIAAAAGALIVALFSLFGGRSDDDRRR